MGLQINLLFTQIPVVGELAGVEAARPETQQAMAQAVATEELAKQRDKVQETDKKEPSRAISDREAGQGGRHSQRREAKAKAKEEQPRQHGPANTPWQGNLVDVDI